MRRESSPTPSVSRGKGSFRLLLTVAAALALTACSPAASAPTNSPAATQPPTISTPTATPATPTAAPTPTLSPAPTTVPSPTTSAITLTDDEGTTITLAAPPHKVISLTPATSELMFALGAGDRLVGRTDFDDYPAQVSSVPAVATFQGVEMEKVVNIGPDLVLAGGNGFTSAADIKRMRDLGFAVLVLYAKDVPGVLFDIKLVGQAVGEQDAADSIATSIQAQVDQVTQAVANLPKPRTFYEIGDDPELYGPAPDSFVADMVTLAGGDAITTTDPSVFSIPVERLVAQDPQVIVLGDAAYGTCPDAVAARPGWEGITAVKSGDIQPVDDTIVTRPGPRIGDGLVALALAIHPDAALTMPADAVAYCTATPGPSPS